MYPRWRSDDLPIPGTGSLGQSRQDLFAEPLVDLEQQLSAELSGASWAVVRFVAADTPWCDWIYRCLNGFPLPPPVVDQVTPYGFRRPDCLSVFPDLRDPTFEEHARQALASSAYLIVVCSPGSARTAAIDQSIRAFKIAGGEERIIALVVDGPPDARLGELERQAEFEWLPAWLRWRCDEKGFCPADRSEPRVIDARRGFASLQQVRDALLTAAVDVEADELERLGAFKRALPELSELAIVPAITMPQTLSTSYPSPSRESSARRDAVFMIGIAIGLIVLAAIFGMKSFLELSADEPQSALNVVPRSTPRVTRFAGLPPVAAPEPVPQAVSEPIVPIANVAAVLAPDAPPAPAVLQISAPAAVAMDAPRPKVPQVSPAQSGALTRVQPPAPIPASVAPPASAAEDAVLLDEVKTLVRRGDEIMAERRTEDALDLYTTALSSAVEYANRKGANPLAKDQVVQLQRKLGMLQLQNASTAEARTSYQQARKTLLQLKAQGVWSRERAKQLDEMESRLLSLPRD